jgi:hypothetical protein
MPNLKQRFQIIPNVNVVRVFIGLGHCSILPALSYKYDYYPHLPLLKSMVIPCINIIICPLVSTKSAISLVAAKRPCGPLAQRTAPSSPPDEHLAKPRSALL